MKMKIYSYIRFSSTQQAQGDSLKRQLEIAEAYAKKVGGVYQKKSFNDMGVSGWSGKKRDGLELMLEMAESGTIEKGSHIVIEAIDRLSREKHSTVQKLLYRIIDTGVCLYISSDEMLLNEVTINDIESVLLLAVKITLAHSESEQKSKRIKSAKLAKKKAGLDGKATRRAVPFWLTFNEETQKYECNDKLFIAEKIIELRQKGLGETKIAQRLNELEMKPPRAAKWSGISTALVYKSPALYGAWQTKEKIDGKYVNSDLIENQYPALITYQDFLLMNPVTNTVKGKDSKMNAFKGLLKCAKCGSIMSRHTFTNYNKTKYVGFRCNDAGKNLGCDAVGYRDMDKFLFKACKYLKIVKQVKTDDSDIEIRQLESKIGQIQQAILTSSDITALITTSQTLEKQLKALKAKSKPSSDVTVEQLINSTNDPQKFNLLARNLIKTIVVDVKKISRVKKILHAKFEQHNGHLISLTVLENGDALYNDTEATAELVNNDLLPWEE